jgi:hypothetical protein
VGGQRHPRPLYSRERDPYPLYRRLGGPQGRYERVRKISPPTEIRSPDRPARSESLYQLHHPGPQILVLICIAQYPNCLIRISLLFECVWNILLLITSTVGHENCMKMCRVGGVSSRKAFSSVHLIHMSGMQTFYFPALEETRFVFASRHSSLNAAKLQCQRCVRDAVKFFIV